MKIQSELKDVLDRSLYFVTAVETILAEVHQSVSSEARARVTDMSSYVSKMKASLGQKKRHEKAREAVSPLKEREGMTHSVSPHTNTKTMKKSIVDSYKKLMQGRAGLSVLGTNSKTSSPSPVLSFEGDTEDGVLPQYNLLTGKVEHLEHLPTLEEYLGAEAFSIQHANSRKTQDKIRKVKKRIDEYYKNLNNLAKQAKTRSPVSRSNSRLEQNSSRLPKLNPGLREQKPELPPRIRHQQNLEQTKPEDLLVNRRRSFRRAKMAQDQDLTNILTRIDRDRDSMLKEKVRIVHMNSQKYRDSLHTLSLFNDVRRILEKERVDRREKAREQMKGYLQICEFYRFLGRKPTEAELKLLEAVKQRLQEGLFISQEDFDLMIQATGCSERATISEFTTQLKLDVNS